jgi:diguanylate cyclase (GGDEF)-like protein/PAS domain S-box-containing protein
MVTATFGMMLDAQAETLEALYERLRRYSRQADNPSQVEQALGEVTVLDFLDQVPDIVAVKDLRSRFVFTNRAAREMAGYRPESSFNEKTHYDLFQADTADRLYRLDQQVMSSGVGIKERVERLVLRDGTILWLSISKTPLRDSRGEVVGLVSISRDVTERKRQEELLQGQARLLEMIARGQPLAGVLEELVKLVEAQLEGVRGSIMLLDESGQRLKPSAAPSLAPAFMRRIEAIPIGPAAGVCGTAAWRRSPVIVRDVLEDPLCGSFRDLAIMFGIRACWSTPIIDAGKRVLGTMALYSSCVREPTAQELDLITMATDLAGIAIERAEHERRIRHMAHHDPLTGLPNRSLFWNEFDRALAAARQENCELTVVYIDLDDFKLINDTLGHLAGDEILKVVAQRLGRCAGPDDLLVRLGGDEFALVLNPQGGIGYEGQAPLDALRRSLAEPITVDGVEIDAGCSIGTAIFPRDGDDPEALLARADQAMYRAKAKGRRPVSLSA